MQVQGMSNWAFVVGFALKTIFGMYFIFIYSEFYGNGSLTADAGDFIREGKLLNDVFYTSPGHYFKFLFGWETSTQEVLTHLGDINHWDVGAQSIINDNRNILRVHSLIHFISFNDPIIHMLILSFLSLFGIKHLVIGLKGYSKLSANAIFWIFLLAPSLIFWGSSVLKEPMVLLGLGLFIRGLLSKDERRKKLLLIFVGLVVLLSFKPYIFFVMIPSLLFLGIFRILPKFKLIGALMLTIIVMSLPLLIFSDQRDSMLEKVARKQFDFNNIGRGGLITAGDGDNYYFLPEAFENLEISNSYVHVIKPVKAKVIDYGGLEEPYTVTLQPSDQEWPVIFYRNKSQGFIEISVLDSSLSQLLSSAPEALMNTLLRPYPNDPGSWLKFPAMLEAWLLYFFIVLAIYKRRKLNPREKSLIVAIVIFIILLSLIIGWTTPVLGAIVRYRLPIVVSALVLGVMIYDPKDKKDRELHLEK